MAFYSNIFQNSWAKFPLLIVLCDRLIKKQLFLESISISHMLTFKHLHEHF